MGAKQSNLSISHSTIRDFTERKARFGTVPECLNYFANTISENEAVVFASTDGGREVVTFKELYDKSKQTAKALVRLGVRRHEFVAVNLRPCPEWLYVTFGAMMAGARPVSISFTYKDGSDLVGMMKKLITCSCMVLDPGYGNENWTILCKLIDSCSLDGTMKSTQMPSLRYLIGHDPLKAMPNVKSFTDLFNSGTVDVELPDIDENDIATLFQTSGSTGLPKATIATHKALLTLMFENNDIFSSDYRYYCDRPFTWGGGFPFNIFLGQTRVTMSGFCSPPEDYASFLIDVIRKENCQMFFTLPPALNEVSQKMKSEKSDLPLKTILTGGQPITKRTVTSGGTICKYLLVLYGGTEFLVASINVVEDPESFEEYCTGYVLPNIEVKIVDTDGKIVPINTRGEIYIRNKATFTGYYNDPEKTKAVLVDNGWYKTDDIGRMTEEGALFVEGRKSNMIISGGMNVVPEILESLILTCPGVDSVVLVPVHDEVLYQVICACVTLLPGSDVNEYMLRSYCENRHGDSLGLFTVLPKYYMILDRLPEISNGKVSRRALTAMAEQRFNKGRNPVKP